MEVKKLLETYRTADTASSLNAKSVRRSSLYAGLLSVVGASNTKSTFFSLQDSVAFISTQNGKRLLTIGDVSYVAGKVNTEHSSEIAQEPVTGVQIKQKLFKNFTSRFAEPNTLQNDDQLDNIDSTLEKSKEQDETLYNIPTSAQVQITHNILTSEDASIVINKDRNTLKVNPSGIPFNATINGGIVTNLLDFLNVTSATINSITALGGANEAVNQINLLAPNRAELFDRKDGTKFYFRSLTSTNNSILYTQSKDGKTVDLRLNSSALTDPLPDNLVTTNSIINGSITTEKLAEKIVTTSKLSDISVTTNKLAEHAVTTDKIAESSITTEKLAEGSVTLTKLAPIKSNTILGFTDPTDATGTPQAIDLGKGLHLNSVTNTLELDLGTAATGSIGISNIIPITKQSLLGNNKLDSNAVNEIFLDTNTLEFDGSGNLAVKTGLGGLNLSSLDGTLSLNQLTDIPGLSFLGNPNPVGLAPTSIGVDTNYLNFKESTGGRFELSLNTSFVTAVTTPLTTQYGRIRQINTANPLDIGAHSGQTLNSQLNVYGNGPSLSLVGTNHSYFELYPRGVSKGKKAYFGFVSQNTNDLSVSNLDSGDLLIDAGTSPKSQTVFASGKNISLRAAPSSPLDAGSIIFSEATGQEKSRIYTGRSGASSDLYFSTGTTPTARVTISGEGHIGLGTFPVAGFTTNTLGSTRTTGRVEISRDGVSPVSADATLSLSESSRSGKTPKLSFSDGAVSEGWLQLNNSVLEFGKDSGSGILVTTTGGFRASQGIPTHTSGYTFGGTKSSGLTGVFSASDGAVQIVSNTVERLAVSKSGALSLSGKTGLSGQLLVSQGEDNAPIWASPTPDSYKKLGSLSHQSGINLVSSGSYNCFTVGPNFIHGSNQLPAGYWITGKSIKITWKLRLKVTQTFGIRDNQIGISMDNSSTLLSEGPSFELSQENGTTVYEIVLYLGCLNETTFQGDMYVSGSRGEFYSCNTTLFDLPGADNDITYPAIIFGASDIQTLDYLSCDIEQMN